VATLRKLGYRLLEAADGQEALEIMAAETGRVELVVTDVVMPRLGGVELAAQVRASQEGLPVVFTTGYAEALRPSDLAPRSALLLKPYSTDELAVEVRRLLDLPRPALASAGAIAP
jgi:CheY-like chemotaxis protein